MSPNRTTPSQSALLLAFAFTCGNVSSWASEEPVSEVPGTTCPLLTSESTTPSPSPREEIPPALPYLIDLDLTSSVASVLTTVDHFGAHDNVSITLDGQPKVVTPGDLLTPAEFAALHQVVTGPEQALVLDAGGRAVSGLLELGTVFSSLASLHVPDGVLTVANSPDALLSVVNGINNSGTLLGVVTAGSAPTYTIQAGNLSVGTTGIVTTVIPAEMALPANIFTGPVSLAISVISDVLNAGHISASGALGVAAGGSIINQAPPESAGVLPVMSGAGGVRIVSGAGEVINAGLVQSLSGPVSIATALARDLLVNNIGGQLISQSLIEVQPSFGSHRTDLIGGLVAAAMLNFSGSRSRVFVDELLAPLNLTGGSADVIVASGNVEGYGLNLSDGVSLVALAGDVILRPNQPEGALSLPGQTLSVLASGNIVGGEGLSTIDLSSDSVGGGLSLIAGFALGAWPESSLGGTGSELVRPEPGSEEVVVVDFLQNALAGNDPIITLDGASPTGGSVILPGVSISASGDAGGGNVTLAAKDNDDLSPYGSPGALYLGGVDSDSSSGPAGRIRLLAESGPLQIGDRLSASGAVGGEIDVVIGEVSSLEAVYLNGALLSGNLGWSESKTGGGADLIVDGTVDSKGFESGRVLVSSSGLVVVTGNGSLGAGGQLIVHARGGGVELQEGSTIFGDGTVALMASGGEGVIELDRGVSVGAGLDLLIQSQEGSVIDRGETTVSAGRVAVVEALNSIEIGERSSYAAGTYLGLLAGRQLSLQDGGSFEAGSFIDLQSNGGISVGKDNVIRIVPPFAEGEYPAPGFYSGGVSVESGPGGTELNSPIDSLGNLSLISGGDLTLGKQIELTARGGYLTLLAAEAVSGGDNVLKSMVVEEGTAGGAIVVAAGPAGLEAEPEAFAAGLKDELLASGKFISPVLGEGGAVADPSLAGEGVTVADNESRGLVSFLKDGGAILDLSGSKVDVRNGAVFVEAAGPSSNVSLSGSEFFVDGGPGTIPVPEPPPGPDPPPGPPPIIESLVELPELPQVEPVEKELPQRALPGQSPVDSPRGVHQLPGLDTLHLSARILFRGLAFFRQIAEVTFLKGRSDVLLGSSIPGDSQVSVESGDGTAVSTGPGLGPPSWALSFGSRNGQPGAAAGGDTIAGSPRKVLEDDGEAGPVIQVDAQRPDLMLFTTASQVITGGVGGTADAAVIGARGTTITNGNDRIVLHAGRFIADAGNKPLLIETPAGEVSVARGGTVAVVFADGRDGVIAALGAAQPDGTAVTIRPSSQSATAVELQPGQQLVFNSTAGGNDASGAGSRGSLSFAVQKEHFSLAEFREQERLGSGSIRLSGARKAAYDRMSERIANSAEPGESVAYRPVSFTEPAKSVGTPARIIAEEGTKYRQERGSLSLLCGTIFLQAKQKELVRSRMGQVELAQGAQVEVEALGDQLRVRSYSGPGHVVVRNGRRSLSLMPGEELSLFDHRPTTVEALPADGIARRRLYWFKWSESVGAVRGDFSVVTSLGTRKHMRLLSSSRRREDRAVLASMLKTAAALNIITSSSGRFFSQEKLASKPRMPHEEKVNEAAFLAKPGSKAKEISFAGPGKDAL